MAQVIVLVVIQQAPINISHQLNQHVLQAALQDIMQMNIHVKHVIINV